MSQENVEAVKRGFEALNSRDIATLLEGLDPDVEFHPAIPVLLGGEPTVYRGHDGLRELLREIDDLLSELHYDISEIRDLDDRVIVIGRGGWSGKTSGVEVGGSVRLCDRVQRRQGDPSLELP